MVCHDDQLDASAVIERVYDAVAAGDREALRSWLRSDLSWRQAGSEVPVAGADRSGADAFIHEVIDALEGEWESFSEPVTRTIHAGPVVVTAGEYVATHARTGRGLRAEFCHIWTVEEGRVSEFRQYTDTAAFAVAVSGDHVWR